METESVSLVPEPTLTLHGVARLYSSLLMIRIVLYNATNYLDVLLLNILVKQWAEIKCPIWQAERTAK